MSKKLGHEEAEAMERWEGRHGQGSGMTSQGGTELSEAAIRQDHSAQGEIAGGAGKGASEMVSASGWDTWSLELKTSHYGRQCNQFPQYETKNKTHLGAFKVHYFMIFQTN